ncbi:MAG TPA: DUF4255 domain-containing protein [Allosphingosinicella sp.]|jgi:hypothetical protein
MSDHRAIAAVTATLKAIIQEAASGAVSQSEVRLGAPTTALAEGTTPTVNLFLFRTTPNAAMRNVHLPTRRSDGSGRSRAQTAVDLHYILTFYGSAAKFEPERLLGAVSLALEERPVMTPAMIESALAAAALAENLPLLEQSDLAEAESRVRIAPATVTLEEFTKIWSIFFQVPYRISVAYVCSHVVVESDERFADVLPVARADVLAGPIAGFALSWAGPDSGGPGPVVAGGKLHLAGKGLGRSGTTLSLDGADTPFETLSDTAVRATLGNGLKVGIHLAQAVAPTPAAAPHLRRRSNTIPFALHPSISLPAGAVSHDNAEPRTGTIKVDFSPPVEADQDVTLTLDSRTVGGTLGVVLDPQLPGAFPAAQLVFPFAGLAKDRYLVRAHVDGFASLPELETDIASPQYGEIVGPEADLVA